MFSKRIGTFFVNAVALLISFLITYVLRFGWEPNEPAFNYVNEAMVLAFLALSYLVAFMVYHPGGVTGHRGVLRLFKDAFLTVLVMAAVFSTLVYTTHIGEAIPRMFFGYFFVIDFVLTFICSTVAHFVKRSFVKKHKRKTVIFTDEADHVGVIRKVLRSERDDVEVVGLVALAQSGKGVYYRVKTSLAIDMKLAKAGLVNVAPEMLEFEFEREGEDALTFLKRHQIDQMIMSVERLDRDKIREIVDAVGEMGIDSMITMDSLAVENFESRMEDFGTMQVIRFAPRLFTEGELLCKRLMDILGSLVGCVICIVVGIFVAPAIWLTDRGPVIYKQQRVGRNGKYFNFYKFRSMYVDADERREELKRTQNEMGDEMMFKMKDDPRITKVGKFIRKTSIDELPQFFNVLKGDMSLVGTRPPMIDEYEKYSRHHKRRLTLKPGITGLWQVSGRSEITDFEEIVRLDCYYIDHWSVAYDIKILLLTVVAVVTGKGSE